MEKSYCRECKHFSQHYALDERKIHRIYCGHCKKQYKRKCKLDTPACKDFIAAPADIEAFASKEYLSKELLRYMMQLELLPKIEDGL